MLIRRRRKALRRHDGIIRGLDQTTNSIDGGRSMQSARTPEHHCRHDEQAQQTSSFYLCSFRIVRRRGPRAECPSFLVCRLTQACGRAVSKPARLFNTQYSWTLAAIPSCRAGKKDVTSRGALCDVRGQSWARGEKVRGAGGSAVGGAAAGAVGGVGRVKVFSPLTLRLPSGGCVCPLSLSCTAPAMPVLM